MKINFKELLIKAFTPKKIENHQWDAPKKDTLLIDIDLAKYWINTFKKPPEFLNKKVVEIGCGFGALCINAFEKGASSILGVELFEKDSNTARILCHEERPNTKDVIDFTYYDDILTSKYDGKFDMVLSMNSFEHYHDPVKVLNRMKELLKPDGYIIAGFGPLWNSPFGAHTRLICRLPWAHLWSRELLLKEYNRLRPHDAWLSFKDKMNENSLSDYEKLFSNIQGLEIIELSYNNSIKRRSLIFYSIIEILRSFSFLREYLTASIFIVLKKL